MVRLLPLALLCLSCGPAVKASVPVVALVGSSPFSCGTSFNLGQPQTSYAPRDFRFYVHDVAVIDERGAEWPFMLDADGTWQTESVALLDFEDASGGCTGTPATHTILSGGTSTRSSTGLRFSLGVPPALNHQDATAATAPLNSTAMFWSWLGGYKYLRLEGLTPGLPTGHDFHLGAMGCQPGATPNSVKSCAADNVVRVTIAPFDVATDALVVDLTALFGGSNLDTNQTDTAPGCMSNANDGDCAPIFERLGLPFGNSAPTTQTVFRKR